MNKFYTFLLVAIFTVSINLKSNAQQILNHVLESGELRVGMTGDQPPFSMTANDGSMFGLDVDMARGLADQIGVKAKLIKMNFKDLIPALERGELDMVISGVTMTIDRNKRVAFIGPYLISGNTVVTKSKEYAKAKNLSDIDVAGVKITVMQGTTSEEFVNANITNATILRSPTNKTALKLIMDGKADIMVAGYPTIAVALLDNRTDGLLTIEKPMDYEPIGIAVAPSDPLLLNLVRNYLNGLERTGILDMLKVKWFEEGSWVLDVEIKN